MKDFLYRFDAGPMETVRELTGPWTQGNCRRAVQLYHFEKTGSFLVPEDVYCPRSYDVVGSFVIGEGEAFDTSKLADGDIIYAQRIRTRTDKELDQGPGQYETREGYLISLHTANWTGEAGREIWHACFIEGGSAYWSLEKFLHFYHPIAVKRIG